MTVEITWDSIVWISTPIAAVVGLSWKYGKKVYKFFTATKEWQDTVTKDLKETKQKASNTLTMVTGMIQLSDVAMFITGEDGQCVFGNDSLINLLGAKKEEEILGFSWLDFIHPDDRISAKNNWDNHVSAKAKEIHDSYRVIDKDLYVRARSIKIKYHAEYKAQFSYKDSGEMNSAVGCVWIITESKEKHEAIMKHIAHVLSQIEGCETLNEIIKQLNK